MKKIVLWSAIFLIVISSLATAVYFYWMYQKLKNSSQATATNEVKTITQTISRFMDLPVGEMPSLATITDEKKLKDQEFFKKAKNGDKVLIYANARKAILYRPSSGRVIEFAPLAVEANAKPIATQIPVALYNGSSKIGLTNTTETKLKTLTELSVIAKENAKKKDYKNTLVIDLTGSNTDLVQKIATLLNGEVSTLPNGEKKPESEILIIVAK